MRIVVGSACIGVLVLAGLVGGQATARADEAPVGRYLPLEYVPTVAQVERVAGQRPTWGRRLLGSGWEADFSIPVWIPGMDGRFTDGGITFEVEQSLGDLFDVDFGIDDEFDFDFDFDIDLDFDLGNLDEFFGDIGRAIRRLFRIGVDLRFGFLGALSVRKGRWEIGLDGFGAYLAKGIEFRFTDGTVADGKLWTALVRTALKYEVLRGDFYLPGLGRGHYSHRAFVGARYYGAGFESMRPDGFKVKASRTWIDPIVGAQLNFVMSRRLKLRAEGDVGGFGVGSDFAWWLVLGADWRLSRRWELLVGYAFMGMDYSNLPLDFAWRLDLRGPFLGFKYSF